MWVEARRGAQTRWRISTSNPDGTVALGAYFSSIGDVTDNKPAWMEFYKAILAVSAASSVSLLRQMRDADIETALSSCKLSLGYKRALCEYLVPRGKPHFVFEGGNAGSRSESKKRKLWSKKYV